MTPQPTRPLSGNCCRIKPRDRIENSAMPGTEPSRAGSSNRIRGGFAVGKLRRALLVCLLLALSALAVYWPVQRFEFISLDDWQYVTGNPYVQAGLSWDGMLWALHSGYASNWHPLTWLSHMLDCQLFGLNAGWHHSTNLFFHIANTLLLFLVFNRLTGAFWRSAFVAALFALHPLHVESVAWVSERKDVLSTFWFLLTLWAYARYAQGVASKDGRVLNQQRGPMPLATRHPSLSYLLALLFFAFGLMSKPMLVTLPFVLLLLDYWPLQRLQCSTLGPQPAAVPRLLWEKLPFFVLSIASSSLTFWAQKTGGSLSPLPLSSRIANAGLSYLLYLRKLVWPSDLAVFYPYPSALPKWQVASAVLLLLLVTMGALAAHRQRPYWAVGWFWYLGTLVPVIGLVQVGGQAMADRYTYIPLIGVFVAMVWALTELAGSNPRRQTALACAGTLLLATYGFLAHRQAAQWKDSARLFTHALAVAPPSAVAHDNLGVLLWGRNELAAAKVHFQAALKLSPANPSSHSNLGLILVQEGKFDEAISHFAEAVQHAPAQAQAQNNWAVALMRTGKPEEAIAHLLAALNAEPFNADAHANLGRLLAAQGDRNQAILHFQQALRCHPDFPEALNYLGSALLEQNRALEAVAPLNKAIRLNPADADAHCNLGNAYAALKQNREAYAEYQTALRLNPGHEHAHYHLGNLMLGDNHTAAAEHFRAALTANPNDPRAHYQLATLLVERKELEEAIRHYHEAVRLKPDWLEALNNLAWLLATYPEAKHRDGPEAVRLAAHAVELTAGQDAEALDTLAAAYAEAGRFAEAIKTAQDALAAAPTGAQGEFLSQVRARLQLYRQQQPCRQ